MRNAAAVAVALLLLPAWIAQATPASDAAFEAGAALMTQKRYAEAAEKFQEVVASDPNNDLAWYQLASAHRKAERCDRAVPAYRRYMDLVTNMPDPYYGLGLCLVKTGDKAGALASLKHFVAVAPRPKSKVWIDHAASVIEELTAPPQPTGGLVDAAVKPTPPSPAAPAYLEAQLLRDRGHIEEAIVNSSRRLRSTLAIRLRARRWASCCSKIRRDDEAIVVLRAVDKNATYSLAWYDLAFGLRARGQHAAAVDAYEHYIKLKPGDPDPYYGLGRSLQHLGRHRRRAARLRDLPVAEKRPGEQRWNRIRRSADQRH